MELLLANLQSGKTRRELLNGREHIVAPLTLIVPGVLNGSDGPIYYPPEEISTSYESWNHTPIVVYHPMDNGKPLSARQPEVLNKSGIGVVLRARVSNGKLVAEGWFDLEQTRIVDMRVYDALTSGTKIELSTGLFVDKSDAPPNAIHNSPNGPRPYTHIARNYRPDHLAILPDMVGACSILDGCGVLVNKSKDDAGTTVEEKVKRDSLYQRFTAYLKSFVDNELSHGEIRERLHKALAGSKSQADPRCYIEEVYDDYFIYCENEKLFKQEYSVSRDDQITLGNVTPVEVKRETSFVPVSNSLEESVMPMTKEQRAAVIDSLVTNCDCWTKDDVSILNGFADEKLTKLKEASDRLQGVAPTTNTVVVPPVTPPATDRAAVINSLTEEELAKIYEKKAKPTTNENGGKATTIEIKATPVTEAEWLANAPESIQNRLKFVEQQETREKTELVKKLVENVKGDAQTVANFLYAKPLDELKTLAALIPERPQMQRPNYVGAATPPMVNASTWHSDDPDDEPLPLPSINWNEKK